MKSLTRLSLKEFIMFELIVLNEFMKMFKVMLIDGGVEVGAGMGAEAVGVVDMVVRSCEWKMLAASRRWSYEYNLTLLFVK